MDQKELLSHVDHTLLTVDATWEQVKCICDEGIQYHVALVCIPPVYVPRCVEYVSGRVNIGACIGFPNGYVSTAVKVFETQEAIAAGAAEIDMVAHIGAIKEQNLDYLVNEIRAVKAACQGKVLKVIIEACLLTREEKIFACKAVTLGGADYIKTSTGFSKGGATREDVALLKAHVGPHVKVKAAGGISSMEDAEAFLALGADRIGTSRIVKLIQHQEATGY